MDACAVRPGMAQGSNGVRRVEQVAGFMVSGLGQKPSDGTKASRANVQPKVGVGYGEFLWFPRSNVGTREKLGEVRLDIVEGRGTG